MLLKKLLMTLLVCMLAPWVWAAKVGPLDGKAGPRLAPLATPMPLMAEVLDDRPAQELAARGLFDRLMQGEIIPLDGVVSGVRDPDLLESLRYADVWRQARVGPVRQTYDLPRARMLERAVESLNHQLDRRATQAFWLGLVPGLGHAYLALTRLAAVNLMLFGLLGWAALFALRARHWPYACVWIFILASLVVASAGDARARALREADTLRLKAMERWDTLKPALPAPRAAPAPSLLPVATVSQELVVSPGDVFAIGPVRPESLTTPTATTPRQR